MTPDEIIEEFAEIGLSVMRLVAACDRVGHTTPAGTLTYVHGDPTPAVDLVRWVTQQEGWQDARDRLLQHARDLGMERDAAGSFARSMAS